MTGTGHPPGHLPADLRLCVPAALTEALSPALLAPAGGAAFELKFLLPAELGEDIGRWARARLAYDPHGDAARGHAYEVHNLYLDTPAFDVFRRTPGFRRRKFRVRRYGSEPGLYLERKAKAGEKVRKRRTPIPEADLARLQEPQADLAWAAAWFHRRVLARSLRPACHVSYDRVAHVGAGEGGPLRLTLDRRIRGAPAGDWSVAEPRAGLPLAPGQVILELKYRTALPALFKDLVRDFRLNPQPASKYRLCGAAWGLDRAARETG